MASMPLTAARPAARSHGSGPAGGPAPGGAPVRRRPPLLHRYSGVLFLVPALLYMALFYGYPIVKNVVMGFQEYTTSTFYTGEAPWVGLDNYVGVVTSSIFGQAMLNTILFTIGSIIGQFVIGLGLALFFSRTFPLSGLLRSLLLLPWLIPLIAGSIVWRWMLDKDNGVVNRALESIGLVETGPGWLTSPSLALVAVIVVNIWIGIPFNATILYGGLQNIPEELYEAAQIDGAGAIRRFVSITWPMLRRVVTVVLVLGVVYTIKVIDIILALTGGGPANSTQTIATQSYHLSFIEFDFGQGAALSNVLIVMSLIFAIVYLRAARRDVED